MIINTLIFLKIVHQIIFGIYFLQFKEYRRDRIKEHVLRKWGGYVRAYFQTSILAPLSLQAMPYKTSKAIVLVLMTTLLYIPPFFYINDQIVLLALLLTTPLACLTALCLFLPIERYMRHKTYVKAREKITKLKKGGLVIIGISGSFGKTTTKYFLNHILSSKYRVLATERSINTVLGMSNVILNELTDKHQIFIAEMAAYKVGEINEMCVITQPDIGILTAISTQHMALFGSQAHIIKGKSELLRNLPEGALALINEQSPFSPIIPSDKKLSLTYYSEKGYKQLLQSVNLPEFLKLNAVPGIILGRKYGISDKKIALLSKNFALPKKTMNESRGYNGCLVIDDTFSANPEGFSAAARHLAGLPYKKKILIMMCLIELGKNSQDIHQNIGALIKKLNITVIVTTDDFIDNLRKGSENSKNIHLITRPEDVIEKLKIMVDDSTAVLLEGKINPSIIHFVKENHV